MIRRPPRSTLFPSRPSSDLGLTLRPPQRHFSRSVVPQARRAEPRPRLTQCSRKTRASPQRDRKSTRLNSSHDQISYAVFCLKKKKAKKPPPRAAVRKTTLAI